MNRIYHLYYVWLEVINYHIAVICFDFFSAKPNCMRKSAIHNSPYFALESNLLSHRYYIIPSIPGKLPSGPIVLPATPVLLVITFFLNTLN